MTAFDYDPDSKRLIEGLESKERSVAPEVQTEIMRAMTARLMQEGFKWTLPVVLAKSTDPL